MKSNQIRRLFLDFFEKRGHKIVPSSSLVPENDPSVLFTTAGMQQFKPYYTGEKNAQAQFGSLNTASIQKCVRTSDVDEVGDESHLTFFEMLGNFSFGGYFKEDAIKYGYEFIKGELGLSISHVSVFGGEDDLPEDSESEKIWKEIDPNLTIKKARRKDNFWGPTGDEGPCGPTTEIYVNNLEIWNIVFNEYYQNQNKTLKKLDTPGVDTGMGLERLTAVVQEKQNIFETDLFLPLISEIRKLASKQDTRAERVIADHLRSAAFMASDGVLPSNTDRGYILRRILRRAVRFGRLIGLKNEDLISLIEIIDRHYGEIYPLIRANKGVIAHEFEEEIEKFSQTLDKGLKEFEKGTDAFILFSTYGFPLEMTLEIAKEKGIEIDTRDFEEKFKEHQDLSRTSSSGMFKGGLADTKEKTVKLHTAHHLLLAALQEILGKEVKQRGSNITEERLRMDFSFPRKLTSEEIKKAEKIVNNHISSGYVVKRKEMPKIEAESMGAEMEFGAKYPDVVSIYFIEDDRGNIISKEFCGGPHVENTGDLAGVREPDGSIRKVMFKILKEEAVAAGVRRIKAALE